MERKKLEELEVGDKVLVKLSGYTKLSKVDRVTKLYIFVDGFKYNKKDGGRSPYYSWDLTHIVPATPEDVAEHIAKEEYQKLLKKVLGIDFRFLSAEQLEQIIGIAENKVV